MTLKRLNLLTSLIAVGASAFWFALGQNATGLIWLACSLVWLALAAARLRSPINEPEPARRLARRLSRMLLWS